MGQTLLLSEQDVHDLLSMEDVVAAVEKTFQGMGEGTVVNPSKVNLDLGSRPPIAVQRLYERHARLCRLCRRGRLKWAEAIWGSGRSGTSPIAPPHHAGEPPHQQLYLRAGRSPDHNMRTGAQTPWP